jgi:hypothetical protein
LRGYLIVARGFKSDSLYVTQVKVCGEVNISKYNSTDLRHLRLGHMSEKGIEILFKRKYVSSDDTSLTSYTHYLAGKQYRVAFKKNLISKKSELLDLVYIDLCSMGDETIGGVFYFVTFVDANSRKLWVYSFNSKDQVLDVFK